MIKVIYSALFSVLVITAANSQCTIDNVSLTTTSCDSNGDFQWIVDFNYSGTLSDSFEIGHSYSLNDRRYAYADLPVTLDPSPGYCNQYEDLWIQDAGNNGCGVVEIPMMPCCIDNGLDNLIVDTICNGDGTFGITMDFDFSGAPSSTFDYYLNKAGYDIIPTNQLGIPYASLPVTFSWPSMLADCASDYDLIIFDSSDPTYTASALDMVICCPPAPCSLTSFTVAQDSTFCLDGLSAFTFDFAGSNFGQNGYTITSSAGGFDTYALGDNKVFSELADCTTDYTLTITDADDSSCTLTTHAGRLCCPCTIAALNQTITCTTDGVVIDVDLDVDGSCAYNGDPVVYVNGVEHVMTLTGGLYVLDTLANDTTQYIIEFCEDTTQTVCTSITVPNSCYTAPCTLSSFTASLDTTSCTGEVVSYNFDFVGSGFGVLGYIVTSTTGSSQTYNYNDPRIFVDLATCDSTTVLTITDLQDSICQMSAVVEPPCCPCMLSNLSVTASACDNGSVDLWANLTALGSCTYLGVDFTVNGNPQSTVDSLSRYYLLDIVSGDSLLTIEACDPLDANNCISITIPNPCYVPVCAINSVTTTWANCEVNGTGDLTIDISSVNAGSAFTIKVGTFTFPTTSNTLTLPNYSFSSDSLDIRVCSALDTSCCYSLTIYNPCYANATCNVEIFSTDWSTAGQCVFMVSFDTTKTGPISILLNGQQFAYTTDSINGPGVALFTDLPITTDSILVEICSISDTTCCDSYLSWNPCPASSTCNVLSFTATADTAACIGDTMPVIFDFTGNFAGLSGYDITVVGQGTYSYSPTSPKIVEVYADCSSIVQLVWQDAVDSLCMDTLQLGPLCCPSLMRCVIEDLTVSAQVAAGDLEITIDVSTTGTCDGRYEVTVDGESLGTYAYADGSIVLTDVTSDAMTLEVEVCDVDDPDMCSMMMISNPLLVSNEEVATQDVKIYQSGQELIFEHLTESAVVKGYTIDGRLLVNTSVNDDDGRLPLDTPYTGVLIVTVIGETSITTQKVLVIN